MGGGKTGRIAALGSRPAGRRFWGMPKTKPSAFDDPAKRMAFVDCVLAGNFRREACSLIGVSYDTYKRSARKKTTAAKAFKAAIEQAECEVEASLVGSVLTMAKAGNFRAAQWYLATKFDLRWGDLVKELKEVMKMLREWTAKGKEGAEGGGRPESPARFLAI
jgi:hypothetical protein